MALTGTISYSFNITDPQDVNGVTINYNPSLSGGLQFTDGTGALKAEDVAALRVTIGGSPTDVNMTTGFETLGAAAIAFNKVKGLALSTPSTNAGNVTVGGDAGQPWDDLLNATGTLTLPPGSFLVFGCAGANGVAVTASDLLQVAGTSGDVLDIRILGESA
jgi:hypothetical protein